MMICAWERAEPSRHGRLSGPLLILCLARSEAISDPIDFEAYFLPTKPTTLQIFKKSFGEKFGEVRKEHYDVNDE